MGYQAKAIYRSRSLRKQSMVGKLARMATLLSCLTISACGPILDLRDELQHRHGPYTPTGLWKRDFWGEPHFVPYTILDLEKSKESDANTPQRADVKETEK
jgi:hypothetical protein